MKIYIYKLTNLINGMQYIGQTNDTRVRWNHYSSTSNTQLIGKDVKKYGRENFTYEILEECTSENSNQRETFYIESLDTIYPKGYNFKTIHHLVRKNIPKPQAVPTDEELEECFLYMKQFV